MGTDKRERKKANRAARLAEEQALEARQRRRRAVRNAVVLTVAVIAVIAVLSLAGCSDDDGDEPAATPVTTSTTVASDPAPDPSAPGGDAPDGEAAYGTTPCPPAEGVDEPQTSFDDSFERCIDPARSYRATFETTEGAVEVDLDVERTPVTTNNFVALARSGYYDGTDLFRIIEASGIVQGGSPHTQSNTDPGPGYTIADEDLPFGPDDYGPGALAMARTQDPDSGGAQFFFVGNENGRYLGDSSQPGGGTYVVFGQSAEGLDVLEAIAALGDDRGTPARQVTVEKVTITES